MSDKAIVVDTPEGIYFYRLLAMRGALKLEMRGLRRRGRSVASIAKEMFKLPKSCRNEVALVRLEHEIDQKMAERRAQCASNGT